MGSGRRALRVLAILMLLLAVVARPGLVGASGEFAMSRVALTPDSAELRDVVSMSQERPPRSPLVGTNDWLCWDQREPDDDDSTEPIDVRFASLLYNCSDDTFVFAIEAFDAWPDTQLGLIGIWIDRDGDPRTGCLGFERFVAGGYDPGSRRYYGAAWRTPTCASTGWESLGPLSALYIEGDLGFASLEFRRGLVGNPTTMRWYGVAIDNRTGGSDFVPEQAPPFVARGFPGSSVNGSRSTAFTLGEPITVPESSDHIVTGDFNGDDRDDLATWLPARGIGVIRFGTRAGGLRRGPDATIRGSFDHLIAGDFNHDGYDDLLLQASGGPELLKLGSATGAFRNTRAPTINVRYSFAISEDFDADGFDDVLLAEPGVVPELVLFGAPRARFASLTRNFVRTATTDLVAGRFGLDRGADVLLYNSGNVDEVMLLGRSGRRDFIGAETTPIRGSYSDIVAGDFNGDAISDVLLASSDSRLDLIRYGLSPDRFFAGPAVDVSLQGTRAVVLDVDGNGRDDVLWYGPGRIGDVLWLGARP